MATGFDDRHRNLLIERQGEVKPVVERRPVLLRQTHLAAVNSRTIQREAELMSERTAGHRFSVGLTASFVPSI